MFAEKPLGGEPKTAATIIEAYERARKPLLVNYSRRYDSVMGELRQEIEGGKWGAIDSVHAIYNRGVMNNGSHAVDLIGFLTGDKPMQVVSVDRHFTEELAGDPTVSAVLKLPKGAVFYLTGSKIRDWSIFEIQIVCEKGIIAIEQSGLTFRRRPAGVAEPFANARRILPGTEQPTAYGTAFIKALDAMVKALDSGERPASDGRSALAAIGLCDSIRRTAVSAG